MLRIPAPALFQREREPFRIALFDRGHGLAGYPGGYPDW